MQIKIKEKNICKNCTFKTCSINDVVEKAGFYHLKSERYVCPVKIMIDGPSENQFELGYIDIDGCLGCDLCYRKCNKSNLLIDIGDNNNSICLSNLNNQMASITANSLASSYLNELFEFAANTNINKSLGFDGYLCEANGQQYFVEVSFENDSLESCRRILGDIALHNFTSPNKITSGIIVLGQMPEKGSRDIFPLVEHISNFPMTSNIKIYIITIDILKQYVLKFNKNQMTVPELMFDIASESIEEFNDRMKCLL